MYVSTQQTGTPYAIDVYRLGWYGGLGGRLMLSIQGVGQAQGYYDAAKGQLVNCATCAVDANSGLVEANWSPSYRLTIPSDWLSGVYLVKFTNAQNLQTYATFDVTGNDHADYALVTTDTTTAAYNDWGGSSLYRRLHSRTIPDGEQSAEQGRGHGSKVSLDRPVAGWGDEQGLVYEINGIPYLERQGYDVAYLSSVDLDETPERLLTHRAYLVFGHDEYWSARMRDGVEHARDAALGLGFFGANIGYWQIRFEPDSHGVADRTIVGYKVAARDPLLKQDPAQVTVRWRQSPVNRPENALIGEMYTGWTLHPHGVPWTLENGEQSELLAGTDLHSGQTYGCDLVGYEWDSVATNSKTPANLRILGASPVTDHAGHHGVSNTTAYRAPSGGLVFAAGTVQWGLALDDYRMFDDPRCAGKTQPVSGLQRLTANVLAALIQPSKAVTSYYETQALRST
jgi:hypothetical protein